MRVRFALLVALAAAASVVTAGSASARPVGPPARIVGHLYVNDNTTGVNTVAGFDRHADGTLTPLPGSPFEVGGAGTGHADASQGSLQLSQDRRYLLAVDAGSDQISVLRISRDGSLQQTDVVSSGGGDPVSIAVHGRLVYVANADADSPDYTGFTLDRRGRLHALPGSTVSLPAGSQPGDVLFDRDGRKLVGTRVASSLIDSFTVGKDGLLTPAPGSPFAAQTGFFGPFGSEFSPTHPEQLFVSNAHTAAGGPAASSVSVFTDAADGALAPVDGSPFAAPGQVASCWVEISRDGRYLYVVNTASSSITTYTVAADGTLAVSAETTLANSPLGPTDARLAPDGKTLWVVDSGGNAVSGFTVDDGTLTELPTSPTHGPSGATPSGIVVT